MCVLVCSGLGTTDWGFSGPEHLLESAGPEEKADGDGEGRHDDEPRIKGREQEPTHLTSEFFANSEGDK